MRPRHTATRRFCQLSLGFLLAFTARAAAAEPFLLGDLAPGTDRITSYADIYTARLLGGVLYFGADDGVHGQELWRSDGTPAGTFRLTDVCPGTCASNPANMTLYRGEVYFAADDGVSGVELWAAGATPGSARRVRDLCPGPCGGYPHGLEGSGGRLLFAASASGTDERLWSSNGSRRGTAPVVELCERPDGLDPLYFPCAGGLTRLGGVVLFTINGYLWRTDGTAAGTGSLQDLVPGLQSFVWGVATLGSGVYLFWSEGTLWRTDGTPAGTVPIKTAAELGIDAGILTFSRGIVWKGLLISATSQGDLVRSDGTREGTMVLARVPGFPNPIGFAPLDGSLLIEFQLPDLLWRTEGTPETTEQVATFSSYSYGIASLGDRALLCLKPPEESEPTQLWISDGTAAGTQRAPFDAGSCGSLGYAPQMPGRALFTGGYGELWTSDGTAAGTSVVHDFSLRPAGGGPLDQIALGDKALFAARTADNQAPLFLSDGTAAGTVRLSDEAAWARGFAKAGNRVFFAAFDSTPDNYPYLVPRGLWATDGTAAGTEVVDPEIRDYRSPMPVGGSLFFTAAREYSYYNQPDLELFRSAGGHTGVVKNINNYAADTGFHHTCYNAPSNPGPGIDLDGRLLFVADEGRNGRELWSSDGTAPGTRLVKDIDVRRTPGGGSECDDRTDSGLSSEPRDFVRYRNGVLFTAEDGKAGRELWWTDGTSDGTRRVKDVRPGAQGSAPHDLVFFRGKVWFIASAGSKGEGLWRSDGTAQGTELVHSLKVAGTPSWARELTVASGRLFFQVYNETTGAELWVSQGTGASTRLVADLRPGAGGSYPQALAAAGGLLVFAADDGTHGLEPWQSDGTAAGTVLLKDVHPGLDASSPGPFTPVPGGALAGADDGVHGREPWVFPLEQ